MKENTILIDNNNIKTMFKKFCCSLVIKIFNNETLYNKWYMTYKKWTS
jgi:hypothetical protein